MGVFYLREMQMQPRNRAHHAEEYVYIRLDHGSSVNALGKFNLSEL